jgi:formylmethanofuran:tetrahydromethanopterin formyltransferase
MTTLAHRARTTAALAACIVAAIGGGYALAALFSVAVLALPISKPQAVLTGQLGSFAVYAGAVIWVFAARSARAAWIGLAIVAAVLAPLAWSAS